MISIDSDIELVAKAACEEPADSGWDSMHYEWGLWEYKGRSGWVITRDSDHIAMSNWRTVNKLLLEEFGPEGELWRTVRAGHWAFGWSEELMVQVLIDKDGEWEEDNITPIFKRCIELLRTTVNDYPLLDDDDHSTAVHEALLRSMDHNWPSWADVEEDHSDNKKVFSWLWEHNFHDFGDDGDWCSEAYIGCACLALGLIIDSDVDRELLDEWLLRYSSDRRYAEREVINWLSEFKAWCEAI